MNLFEDIYQAANRSEPEPEKKAEGKKHPVKEAHDDAAWNAILAWLKGKDSKWESVVDLIAETWNGGIQQWISNGYANEEGRMVLKMLNTIGTDASEKVAEMVKEALASDFYKEEGGDESSRDRDWRPSREEDYEELYNELDHINDEFYRGLDDQLVKDLAAKLGVTAAAKTTEVPKSEESPAAPEPK